MEDISLITYLVVIAAIALMVIFNYKKSQRNYKNRKHKRFRDSYLEKKKNRNNKS